MIFERTCAYNAPQVIEYLSKKGYSKTEATLRAESASQDAEGRPLPPKTEDIGGVKYRQGFGQHTRIRSIYLNSTSAHPLGRLDANMD